MQYEKRLLHSYLHHFKSDLISNVDHMRNSCTEPSSVILSQTISFQEYVSKGITHPVFYGDLVYKLRRVKGKENFISSGSKIMKRLRRRQYDHEIIEMTISLVLGPNTYHSWSVVLWLTMRFGLHVYYGPCLNLLRGDSPDPVPSDYSRDSFSLWNWGRVLTARSTAYFNEYH